MSTLYRDYRPQNFSGVLGQNHIKITLQNEIAANKLAQSFLFCGPRAVGKTTLARILAKAVNCLNRPADGYEPCNDCPSCLSITAGKNLDVVEIDAASNTGVDNIRENIILFSRLAPVQAKFKVFIIDEVHMLSLSAFNALLKIIEEPPVQVIFILCTTEVHKVPLTIISRCERFDFQRIGVGEIVKKLSQIASQENIDIDHSVLEAVARRSDGHLRDAESLLGQIFSLDDKKITLEQAELVLPHYNSQEAVNLLDYLNRKDIAKALALVNDLADSGVNIKNFIGEMLLFLRKVMLDKLNPELSGRLGLDWGETLEIKLTKLTETLSPERIFAITRRFLDLASDSQKNTAIPQLPLELAVAELCLASVVPSAAPANTLTSPQSLVRGTVSQPNKPNLTTLSRSIGTKDAQKISSQSLNANVRNDSISNPISNSISEVESAPTISSDAFKINAATLSQADIIEKWPEFLIKIKKYNHSLSFVLQNCEPQGVKDGQLCLVFKYKFHRDRINDINIRAIVEQTLAEVYGAQLTFNSLIDENLEIKRPETTSPALETSDLDLSANSHKTTDNLSESLNSSNTSSSNNKKSGGLITDLLKSFGGEVIN